MLHLIEKFMLGLLEMVILWLAYVAFIKLVIQDKQNKQ